MKSSVYTLKNYVPESLSQEGKDKIGTRVCVEDCAVLDASRDLLILQSRGIGLTPSIPFAVAIGMTEEELCILLQSLEHHTRFLMVVGERPLLIFADWLKSTGLVLAILPHTSFAAAHRALLSMERLDIALPDREPEHLPARQCRQAHTVLTEILRYTDCLLSNVISPSHFLLTASTFSGCRLEIDTVFFDNADTNPLGDRLSALLLCVFLYIRGIAGSAKHEAAPTCRLSLGYHFPAVGSYTPPAPDFLDAPCFADVCATRDEGRFSFALPAATELSVNAAAPLKPRIILEFLIA